MTALPPLADSTAPASSARAAAAQAHRRYWRYNLIVIAVLFVPGGVISFVVPLFAPALAPIHWRGWSLPYYLGAQGATLLYVLLIAIYIVLMQRADRRLKASLDAIAAVDAARQSAARAAGPAR
jgi:putative solute:sodium symporter small subunit